MWTRGRKIKTQQFWNRRRWPYYFPSIYMIATEAVRLLMLQNSPLDLLSAHLGAMASHVFSTIANAHLLGCLWSEYSCWHSLDTVPAFLSQKTYMKWISAYSALVNCANSFHYHYNPSEVSHKHKQYEFLQPSHNFITPPASGIFLCTASGSSCVLKYSRCKGCLG
jgi:hypothetical protein